MPSTIFPNNIRNIRLANGMKMTELARQSNLSLSAVSKIEKGVRRLNQKQLLNICNILGCKLSDIFIKESDDVAGQWQNEIKRRLTIFFQARQPGAEIPLEVAIDEYNVFHAYPAAIKSKEEVKELIKKVLEKNVFHAYPAAIKSKEEVKELIKKVLEKKP